MSKNKGAPKGGDRAAVDFDKERSPEFKIEAKGKIKDDTKGYAKSYRTLKKLVKNSGGGKRDGKKGGRPSRGAPVAAPSAGMQRCSVRVNYSKNEVKGQWAAHGKYIERESAALDVEQESGLDQSDPAIIESEAGAGNERTQQPGQPGIPDGPGISGGGGIPDGPGISDAGRERVANSTGKHIESGGSEFDRGIKRLYGLSRARAADGWSAALHFTVPPGPARKQAPQPFNAVRGMSRGDVDSPADGASVLLSGHAPGYVVPGSADGRASLRRETSGGNGNRGSDGKEKVTVARGFGSAGDQVSISETLDSWQKAGDQNLFKMIVSPEFGERMDLKKHTKDLVAKMERDMGTGLQWVAVEHFNTDNPHVHLAVRGVDARGKPLRIGKEYIKTGLRARAQEAATDQIGYRTPADMKLAADRQIIQQRFTDIDRGLKRKAKDTGESYRVDFNGPIPKSVNIRENRLREIHRLQQLTAMGLAKKSGPLSWDVDKSFENTLRQMQIAGDRLKSMHAHREVVSDPRVPFSNTDLRKTKRVAGRVLGTGLDEDKGLSYILVEGVDAKVHYLYQDKAMEEARQAGKMKPGSFVEIERRFVPGQVGARRSQTVITDKGPADALLTDQAHLATEAFRASVKQPHLPRPSGVGGWLGRHQQAVAQKASEMEARGQLKLGPNGFEYQPRTRASKSR